MISGLQETTNQQNRKIANLEDHSRRANLIVFGVDERPNEDEAQLRTKVVNDIFND